MAKILGVYERWQCKGCEKVAARIKLEGAARGLCRHVGTQRNRLMRRLQASGWKFEAFRFKSGRKGRRSWCPDCADNKRCNCAECKRGRNLPAWLPGGAPIEHFVSRTQVIQYVHPKQDGGL